ncbi:unnamed protein product [Callosobruchus maculatus]|uniref:Enkurin domain-containing protein n=1 Tax=Callosobruchus maculatus TaxID=64391 RepID=A0A653D0G2_CALMS|nr:unnamed protein product [Callosobruchus maculatus]
MSVILMTSHDENIYNITKTQDLKKMMAPAYKSKFRDKHRQIKQYKECVKLHATMGVPEEEPPDPSNYLKKHTGKPSYTSCQPIKEPKSCLPRLKDPLPDFKNLEAPPEHPTKNFVAENIKAAKNMKVKEPDPRTVIDNRGKSIEMHKAGLEPVYIKAMTFGRTPKYLERFMAIREAEYQKKKDSTGVQQPLCRYITRDQREKLLSGLKQNWEELQKIYQGLPILTDTIPKKFRKSKLEAELKQLEKDIVFIERHPYIYVYKDSEFNV